MTTHSRENLFRNKKLEMFNNVTLHLIVQNYWNMKDFFLFSNWNVPHFPGAWQQSENWLPGLIPTKWYTSRVKTGAGAVHPPTTARLHSNASLQHLEETKLSIMHNQLASLSWQGRIIHVIIIIEEKFTSSKNLSIYKIFQLAADVEHSVLDLLIHHFIDMTIQ